ncbi:MAG TPA: hypothetical protein VJ739_04390, partial [Gemmataceae bacterium]|nr:hypothetical protein [Gemmataceae bacterium]
MKPIRAVGRATLAALGLAVLLAAPLAASEPAPLGDRLLDAFTARPLGPANMGGRVVDVAVVPNRPA